MPCTQQDDSYAILALNQINGVFTDGDHISTSGLWGIHQNDKSVGVNISEGVGGGSGVKCHIEVVLKFEGKRAHTDLLGSLLEAEDF